MVDTAFLAEASGKSGQSDIAALRPKPYHTPTLTYQNLLFCRVPINSILGCIIRTYKKVGFGRLR